MIDDMLWGKPRSIREGLALVEYLEGISPYRNQRLPAYSIRVVSAVEHGIPKEFRRGALSLFAAAVYLPTPLLARALRHAWQQFLELNRIEDGGVSEEIHFFELDHHGLLAQLCHEAGIEGRLDTDRFARTGRFDDLLDKLMLLLNPTGVDPRLVEELLNILQKTHWVLLTDNVLSGTSVISEGRRMLELVTMLKGADLPHPKHVTVVSQVATDLAATSIYGTLGRSLPLVSGITISNNCRITDDNCVLIEPSLLPEARRFCVWFARHFMSQDTRLKATMRISGDDLRFGFKQSGLTLVRPENCPSNTVPAFWYWPSRVPHQQHLFPPGQGQDYSPPFPRVGSRISQKTGHSSQKLSDIKDNWDVISSKIKRASNSRKRP